MKWDLTEPKMGDAVRVKINEIYHYGIFVSENEVIQFGLPPSARANVNEKDIEVCYSSVDVFLQGGFLERGTPERKDGKKRSSKKVVRFAKDKLGQKGYNLIHNNCEHFVYECLFGYKKSTQTDGIRQIFMNMPIVDVYTALIPEAVKIKKVFPRQRNKEIKKSGCQKVKIEKYCAWKLLEYAFIRTFGVDFKQLKFNKTEHGKWQCDGYYFSISHSNSVVAVAISRKPIGVDVEKLCPPKKDISQYILTPKEMQEYLQEEKWEHALTTWCKKESIFKKEGVGNFIPKNIETTEHKVYTSLLKTIDGEYILSVCADLLDNVRCFNNIDLLNV